MSPIQSLSACLAARSSPPMPNAGRALAFTMARRCFETAPRPAVAPPAVLVKVCAAAITLDELLWDETWTRGGQDRTPIIPSHEWSEVVEEADRSTGFRAGDEVFGMVPFVQDGAAAEYVANAPDLIATKPAGLSHVEAAALPLAGLTAWQALADHTQVGPGKRVLVLGAAGGVGAFAVQLAVVWVRTSPRRRWTATATTSAHSAPPTSC